MNINKSATAWLFVMIDTDDEGNAADVISALLSHPNSGIEDWQYAVDGEPVVIEVPDEYEPHYLDSVMKADNRARIPEPELVRAHYEGGKFDVYAKHPVIPILADQLAKFFEDQGATNYVEMRLGNAEGRSFALTLQEIGKLSPHDKVVRAEAQIAELEAEVERLKNAISS